MYSERLVDSSLEVSAFQQQQTREFNLSSRKKQPDTPEATERTTILPSLESNESLQHWLKRVDAKPGEVFFCGFNPNSKSFEIQAKNSNKSTPHHLQFKIQLDHNLSKNVSIWGSLHTFEPGWILLGNDNELFKNQFSSFYAELCSRIFPVELPLLQDNFLNDQQFSVFQELFEQILLLRNNNLFSYFQELMMMSCNPSGEISSTQFMQNPNNDGLIISEFVLINMLMFGRYDFLLVHMSEKDLISMPLEFQMEYADFCPIRIRIENTSYFDIMIQPPGTTAWIPLTRERYDINRMHFEPELRRHLSFIDEVNRENALFHLLKILEEQDHIRSATHRFMDVKCRARNAYVLSGGQLDDAVNILISQGMEYSDTLKDQSPEAKIISSYEEYDSQLFGTFMLKLSHDEDFIKRYGARGLQILRHGLAYFSVHFWYSNLQLGTLALNDATYSKFDYAQKLQLLADRTDASTIPFDHVETGNEILRQLDQLMFTRSVTEEEFKERISVILNAYYNPEN